MGRLFGALNEGFPSNICYTAINVAAHCPTPAYGGSTRYPLQDCRCVRACLPLGEEARICTAVRWMRAIMALCITIAAHCADYAPVLYAPRAIRTYTCMRSKSHPRAVRPQTNCFTQLPWDFHLVSIQYIMLHFFTVLDFIHSSHTRNRNECITINITAFANVYAKFLTCRCSDHRALYADAVLEAI